MKERTRGGLLMGAGFLLGTVGVKALTSATAKKCYVQGVAKGLQAKSAYEGSVEQAKAQVDDIVAEANYINLSKTDATEHAAGKDREKPSDVAGEGVSEGSSGGADAKPSGKAAK